jgi:Protein of unknown function (DUF4013)
MNYTASVTDFFKSPKWMMNLLLGGVCVLIPIVGQIVVMGWLITGFWGREDKKPETFPAFNFEEFGKYLERGLWPFLVVLVASFLVVPIMFIFMIPLMFLGGLLAGHQGNGSDFGGAILGISMALLYLLMTVLIALLIAPLKLRASLTQDFVKSFNFAFIMRFIALTWKEIIVAWLFLIVAGIGLTIVGALVFCVGIYFAAVVLCFAWTHLYSQLYLLYLSRGGEPVPRSPKLSDGPPPLTAA